MKRGTIVLISFVSLLTFVLLISLGSAEIMISQPKSLYSVGDNFNVSVTLSPSVSVNDYLSAKLVCEDGSVELYKNPISTKAGEQKDVLVSTTLDRAFIGNLTGRCLVRISYGSEVAESQNFDISGKVSVYLEVQGIYFEPGKEVKVSGKATKANGDLVNGFIQASIGEMNVSISRQVSQGVFDFSFLVPSDARSGTYQLNVEVYERDSSGNAVNYGESNIDVRVNQVPKDIDVALNKESIVPGEDLIYSVVMKDQAGDAIGNDIALIISQPDDSSFIKKVVKAGESNTLNTVYNYTPGYWKIDAKSGDLEIKKIFYIEELEKATFEVINGTLVVTNMGNVPYNKPVQISIGGSSELLENLNVGVDGEKTVKLNVNKDGEYDISVNDGSVNQSLGRSTLTGKAIDYEQVFSGKYSPAFWAIIVLILAGIVYYFYRKVREKKFVGTAPKTFGAPIRLMSADRSDNGENKLIDSGQRGEAAVVALRIKNIEEVKQKDSNAPGKIRSALETAKAEGGRIYADGDYRVIVFSQMITKEADNNSRAVKVANTMANMLNEHNKNYGHKIDFGIGVNNGEMIGENKEGTIKFTPIGNTVIVAKRIAEKSNGELLLAGSVHRRVLGSVKCEKMPGMDYWKVVSITNRDKHSGFIEGFMKRQEGKDFFGK